MSSVTSLGISQPSALDHLIQEGLLGPDPSPNQYRWETFNDTATGLGPEEVLITAKCAVWSRGGVIRRVFRLDIEDQDITQAVLTWFDRASPTTRAASWQPASGLQAQTDPSWLRTQHVRQSQTFAERTRALVVILTKQAHIYFEDGSSHVVHLPFEVGRASPSSRGLSLQRRLHEESPSVAMSTQLLAPPNSFTPARRSVSPSVRPSTNKSLRFNTPESAQTTPKRLEDFAHGFSRQPDAELPRLFTLVDPLQPVGVVVEAIRSTQSQPILLSGVPTSVEMSTFSTDEDLLYISPSDEVDAPGSRFSPSAERPLLLALTFNRQSSSYNIWYCSYQKAKTAASWRQQQEIARREAEKRRAKSRLSLPSGNAAGLGRRGGARDSFLRASLDHKSFRASPEPRITVADSLHVKKSRKSKANDSTSQPLESPEKAKALNRRKSSMLARTELTTQEPSALPDLGLRAPSFSRRKQSFRLSQVSTRSSFLASQIFDEDSMLDDTLDSIDGTTVLLDELDLQDPFDDTRRDLTMIRVASIPAVAPSSLHWSGTALPCPSVDSQVSVFSCVSATVSSDDDDTCSLLMLNKDHNILSQIALRLRHVALPGHVDTLVIPVVDEVRVSSMSNVLDYAKVLRDGVDALTVLRRTDRGTEMFLQHPQTSTPLSTTAPGWRCLLEETDSVPLLHTSSNLLQEIAPVSKRSPLSLATIQKLSNPDHHGAVDLVDHQGLHHRVEVLPGANAVDTVRVSEPATTKMNDTTENIDSGLRCPIEKIWRHDTAFVEASKLLSSHVHPIAVLNNPGNMSETQFLEAERAHAQLVGIRSTATTTGTALLDFHCSRPLPTQELEISLWETQIRMMPSGHIMTISRDNFSEPKSAWAAYHAGVAAGLHIERDISSIDSSWICLNKPQDPNNRHAGLLLGLGMNGYLKTMPRWLVFKYLTPKHEMTSISLLLGLSASHLGTMNTLVIKVLSIHLVSLLPPGAAELNLSSLVQTAGTMGVGLLYYNTQHRRMSEVLLSELEHFDREDPYDGNTKFVRDEGYRLAAGFALGLVNLGYGQDLRSLQDLRVEERLLALATGPKDVAGVNVTDQAAAGATMALALIFMKTNNTSLARKISPPSARPQFDYIRPDVMLLRVVAKCLIMWDEIEATDSWLYGYLPQTLQEQVATLKTHEERIMFLMGGRKSRRLRSTDLHNYSIVAGLCWSLSLKYAGTADLTARNIILNFYDAMNSLNAKPQTFDERLVCATLLRLQHLLLLSAATVMSGTGDIEVLRRARILHGTVNEHSTFGLHQAAHMVIGALFLGQSRFTFGTSTFAVASLLIAFYPLFPKEVMDNKAHLQAFRHFWTFATEPSCVFPRDAETKEVVVLPLEIELRDGTTRTVEAPALLHPSLEAVSKIRTVSEEHDPVVIDFDDPSHRQAFLRNQTIWLRKRSLPAQYDNDPFEIALALKRAEAIDPRPAQPQPDKAFVDGVFDLDVFGTLGLSEAHLRSIFPRTTFDRHAPAPDYVHYEPATSGPGTTKHIESELLRAMPTLTQYYAPPKRDENAAVVLSTDATYPQKGEESPFLESLLDINTTEVDEALVKWGDSESGLVGKLKDILDLEAIMRGGGMGPGLSGGIGHGTDVHEDSDEEL